MEIASTHLSTSSREPSEALMLADDTRPDPDALLAAIQKERSEAKRGRLKILFGMCPGVGRPSPCCKPRGSGRRKERRSAARRRER